MELNRRQLAILYGMLLGDACLQKTGKSNARLRIEHSYKQQAFVDWKFQELEHIFQSEPQFLKRTHPKTKHVNKYCRLQSYAFPFLGKLKRQFYSKEGIKKLPDNIDQILTNTLTIAVWYMDDGYYDNRDKSAHIYLQAFSAKELETLISCFKTQHNIKCKAYCRPDRKACQLNFRKEDKNKLIEIIKPHLIKEMRYKTPLDPVTTDSTQLHTCIG